MDFRWFCRTWQLSCMVMTNNMKANLTLEIRSLLPYWHHHDNRHMIKHLLTELPQSVKDKSHLIEKHNNEAGIKYVACFSRSKKICRKDKSMARYPRVTAMLALLWFVTSARWCPFMSHWVGRTRKWKIFNCIALFSEGEVTHVHTSDQPPSQGRLGERRDTRNEVDVGR